MTLNETIDNLPAAMKHIPPSPELRTVPRVFPATVISFADSQKGAGMRDYWPEVLVDLRRVLEIGRPDLVAEFDAIGFGIRSGPQLARWLNFKLGYNIVPATQSLHGLPIVIADHFGVEGFQPTVVEEDDEDAL